MRPLSKISFLIIVMIFSLAENSIAQQKKNVLFIMADDFNIWLNKTGYYPSHTPNLDKLAEKGILFKDASSASPVCNPSRNAIWSGLRPVTTGIDANGTGYVRDKKGFERVITMNEYFKSNGYYVFGSGKLYHPGAMGGEETDPNNWSELYKEKSGSQGGKFYKWESKHKGLYKWNAGEFDINQAGDTKIAHKIADIIENYDDKKPFFLGAGLFRPHLPWQAHKKFFDMFDPATLKRPKGYLENDADDIKASYNGRNHYDEIVKDGVYQEALRAYLANLAYADYNVGIMLDALEKSKFKDNTIVVFMGDHGWHLGEKDRFSKHAVFDLASRTTFIIYDPSVKGNGEVSEKVVSLQDAYPTLVELCGLDPKADIQGNSLVSLLEKPNRKDWEKPILITYRGTHIIKTNKWRLIDNGAKSQLYDIENDPYEWYNLYGKKGYTDNDELLISLRNNIIQMTSESQGLNIVKGKGQSGNITTTDEPDEEIVTAIQCEALKNISDLKTDVTSCSEVILTWTLDPCALGYIIRRKRASDKTFENLNTRFKGNTYTDESIERGVTYVYQVRPYDETGNKKMSNMLSVKTPSCPNNEDTGFNSPSKTLKKKGEYKSNNQLTLSSNNNGKGNVITYPSDNSDKFLPLSDIYTVTVIQGDKEYSTSVYKSQSNADNTTRARHILNNSISWTNFSFSGTVKVRVQLKEGQNKVTFPSASILPKRHNIGVTKIDNRTLEFTLNKAGQYSVEFGKDGFKNGLMIFADPLEKRKAPKGTITKICNPCTASDLANLSAYKAVHFKDNRHHIGTWDIPANIKEIYIAGGAVVKGALNMPSSANNNILIHGRGILDGGGLYYPWTSLKTHGIEANINMSNVTLEGITISQAGAFFVRLLGTNNRMEWIKTIGGWNFNNDGLVGYKNTYIGNSFVWANDDGIKLYRDNQKVENIVMWHLVNGGCFQWAWNTTSAKNINVSNVDIIHAQWNTDGFNQGVFNCRGSSHNKGVQTQKNWVFENINIDTPVKVLFNLRPQVNHTIKNTTFKNIKASTLPNVINRIEGNSVDYPLKDISIINLKVNGKCISSSDESGFELEHTKGVSFSCEEASKI